MNLFFLLGSAPRYFDDELASTTLPPNVRGELLSLSLGCHNTLNLFGVFPIFSEEMYLLPFLVSLYLFLGCRYCNIFFLGGGGGCTFFSECVYLFDSFPLLSFCFFFFSLSIFFYRWFGLLLQVKQNRLGLPEFLLQWGRGRVCTIKGRAGDLMNMDENK